MRRDLQATDPICYLGEQAKQKSLAPQLEGVRCAGHTVQNLLSSAASLLKLAAPVLLPRSRDY